MFIYCCLTPRVSLIIWCQGTLNLNFLNMLMCWVSWSSNVAGKVMWMVKMNIKKSGWEHGLFKKLWHCPNCHTQICRNCQGQNCQNMHCYKTVSLWSPTLVWQSLQFLQWYDSFYSFCDGATISTGLQFLRRYNSFYRFERDSFLVVPVLVVYTTQIFYICKPNELRSIRISCISFEEKSLEGVIDDIKRNSCLLLNLANSEGHFNFFSQVRWPGHQFRWPVPTGPPLIGHFQILRDPCF